MEGRISNCFISLLFFLAAAFQFTPIDLNEYAIALGLAILIIPIMEIVKFIQRKLGV